MNAAKDCTLQEKLLRCAMALILAAGALLYAALTLAGCRRAERSFEQLDL